MLYALERDCPLDHCELLHVIISPRYPIDDWPRRSALGCDLNGLVPANLEWMAKQLAWHLVANTPTGFAESVSPNR